MDTILKVRDRHRTRMLDEAWPSATNLSALCRHQHANPSRLRASTFLIATGFYRDRFRIRVALESGAQRLLCDSLRFRYFQDNKSGLQTSGHCGPYSYQTVFNTPIHHDEFQTQETVDDAFVTQWMGFGGYDSARRYYDRDAVVCVDSEPDGMEMVMRREPCVMYGLEQRGGWDLRTRSTPAVELSTLRWLVDWDDNAYFMGRFYVHLDKDANNYHESKGCMCHRLDVHIRSCIYTKMHHRFDEHIRSCLYTKM